MTSFYLLEYSETLMKYDDVEKAFKVMGNSKQHVGYRTLESLNEAYKLEYDKDVYDGEFDYEYTKWVLSNHEDFDEEHDGYFGFERIFKSVDTDEEVVYKVTVEEAILVD